MVPRAGGGGGGGGGDSGGGGSRNTLSRDGAAPQQIDEPSLTADSYVAVGLATCFERDVDTGKLTERMVVEPISASSLECMANGARTSFRFAAGTTLGALMRGGGAGGNPGDALPEEYRGAALCANWARRVEAAARTWQRPHAQDHLMDIAPLPAKSQAGGRPKARGGFNFSLDDKRVLNSVNVVTDADNVKQDISIDVYGRAEAEAAAKAEEGEGDEGGGAVAAAALGGGAADGNDPHALAEAARARATAPCDHMGGPGGVGDGLEDSSDEEDELDALLAA
jgi:phosphatidylinositol glycan class S